MNRQHALRRLSRGWFLFLCWPSTLRPAAYCGVAASLLAVTLGLLYLSAVPPSSWEQTVGAAPSEQEREVRRKCEEEIQRQDAEARRERDREALRDDEQRRQGQEKEEKKASQKDAPKKGGK